MAAKQQPMTSPALGALRLGWWRGGGTRRLLPGKTCPFKWWTGQTGSVGQMNGRPPVLSPGPPRHLLSPLDLMPNHWRPFAAVAGRWRLRLLNSSPSFIIAIVWSRAGMIRMTIVMIGRAGRPWLAKQQPTASVIQIPIVLLPDEIIWKVIVIIGRTVRPVSKHQRVTSFVIITVWSLW